jgi:hypothetical protein
MTENKLEVIKGLMCPSCGGPIELIEGNNVLKCPFCDTSLLVMGDEGVLKYHVRNTIDKGGATDVAKKWFSKSDKDRKLKKEVEFTDIFLIHIPFWRSLGIVNGWIFGNEMHTETHRDSKGYTRSTTHRAPIERMVMQDYLWNRAACDVSEFGVESVDNSDMKGNLQPFDFNKVEKLGMIFEPTHARTDALDESEKWMLQEARKSARVDKIIFEKLHVIGKKLSIVYYPLWVLRYTFKDRNYQVVVDGLNSKLLYGRAPGSSLYRVGMFTGSLMVGNLILTTSIKNYSSDDGYLIGLIAGLVLILFGFSTLRYGGEVIEGKTLQPLTDRSQQIVKIFGVR